jgi:microcystin degradation protein MlrC
MAPPPPTAAKVIVADSGAFASPDHTRLEYKNLRRPIYPLDADVTP